LRPAFCIPRLVLFEVSNKSSFALLCVIFAAFAVKQNETARHAKLTQRAAKQTALATEKFED